MAPPSDSVPAPWVGPLTTVFMLSGWITSVCLHEFGHALAAHLGGDTEVARAGYLTLNPLRYSHPLLSIVLPVLFLVSGGLGRRAARSIFGRAPYAVGAGKS